MTGEAWNERLRVALATDDAPAARRLVDTLRDDAGVRDDLLHLLATRAAAGTSLAVQLLAEVVDDLGLARAGVRRVLVDEAAVDDAAQDTLVSMVTSVGRFRGDARFTTWLFQIARNRAVDHLRRQRATQPLADDDVGEARRISSIIATRRTVHGLVEQLPPGYRDAVVLRDISRLSYAEASDRMGLNINTVKSHVARGRALMAKMLEDSAP